MRRRGASGAVATQPKAGAASSRQSAVAASLREAQEADEFCRKLGARLPTEAEHFQGKTHLKLIGRQHMLLDMLQKI